MPDSKSDAASPPPKSRWEGLLRRIVTALIFAAVVFTAGYMSGLLFTAFIVLVAMQLELELYRLTRDLGKKWRLLGTLYIFAPCISILWIHDIELPFNKNAGTQVLILLVAMIAATDIGAYFSGRLIGGPKLAPTISPNKTWAGLFGGMVMSCIAALLMHPFLPVPVPCVLLGTIGIITAGVAQSGDLFESWLKRQAGVKDSGKLLPGHGGLLDRVDGFMFTAPLLALLLFLSGLAS